MPVKSRTRTTLTKGKIGRPSKSVSEALDETLLELATQALREAHFSEISLEKLAARIGVSKPTIYRRYENRDALIEALVKREFALLLQATDNLDTAPRDDECVATSEPLNRLRGYAQNMFNVALRPSTAHFVGFLHQEGLSNPRLVRLRHEWHLSVMNHLARMIRDVQANGEFADSDPMALASLLIDLMNGSLALYPMGFSQTEALSGMPPQAYFEWRFGIFLSVAARPVEQGGNSMVTGIPLHRP